MQRITLLIIIIICSAYHYAEAQNLKGKWMIGTKILDLQINKSDKSIEMEPSLGRYITDKFGLGLTGVFNYGQSGNQKALMKYDFGPFTKYYFASLGKKSYLFAGINLLYGKSQFIAPDGDIKSDPFTDESLDFGYSLFLSHHLSFELVPGFHVTQRRKKTTAGFSFGIRFESNLGRVD